MTVLLVPYYMPLASKHKLSRQGISSQHESPSWIFENERELVQLLDKKNEIEEQINEVCEKIPQGMYAHGTDKIHSEHFSVSYTPPKKIMQFDSKAFRIENEYLCSSHFRTKQR